MATVEVIKLIIAIVGMIGVCFSIYFGLKNSKRTDEKDIAERVKNNTEINIKLDNIATTSNDTRKEIAALRDDLGKHNDRIIKVEESLKSFHHRLDSVENRLNERGD